MGNGDDEGGNNVYKGSTELVLVLLSDSYLEDYSILISDSRPSSSPAYTATNYCLKKSVCNFVLRRTFYSK